MQLDTLLLIALVFMAVLLAALISDGNRKVEKLNDRLEVFWQEYVRKGGAVRHDDF